jgi:HSP90 family molecular chaperone
VPAAQGAQSVLARLTAEGALDLYQRLTGDRAAPLLQVHVEDAVAGVRALLFVPAHRPMPADRLQVYAGGAQAPELGVRLLPPQYGFVAGVVEFDTLPEAGRAESARATALHQTGRLLARSLRAQLEELAYAQPEDFQLFWDAHGGHFGIGAWVQRLNAQPTPA